jgi:CheY-like chemotaxis protein
MPDYLVAELRATLQSLGSAVHMLRQTDSDPSAVAFICGSAEQRLREILAGIQPVRTKRRVLIADPERNWAGALAQALSEKGHEVRAAATADEALARTAGGFAPDVVLLDIAMGQTSAYDLVRKLRSDGRRPEVVAITGWNRASDRSLARHAGIRHYLAKPVTPEAVVDLVATLP